MALREVAREFVPDQAEAEKIKDFICGPSEVVLVAARLSRSKIKPDETRARAKVMSDDDTVARSHTLEDRRLLKRPHHAFAGDSMRVKAGNHLAVESDFAPARPHE